MTSSGGPQSQGPTAPPGWYPAPEGYGRRYWDGSGWTDRFESEAPVMEQLREQEQRDRRDRLTFWGYVGALLLTPAGIVIGIILLVRRNVRHGVGVLGVAIVASLIWNLVFFDMVFGEGDGATTGTVDAAYLEEDLPDAFLQNSDGDLTGVDCIERGDNDYRCLGDYTPTDSQIREQFGDLSNADIKTLAEQQTGPITLEVTVDPDDGSYIYEFR